MAATPGSLAGHEGRPAAQEGVQNDVAAPRHIEDRVGDHRRRLDRRMQGREVALLARATEPRAVRVAPNVGAVAAVLA